MSLNNIKINNTTNVKTGVVYDISKATEQSYDTLADALSGNNVPPEVREGGMSVRFVHTGDNKYMQYRLTVNSWSVNPYFWENYNDVTTYNQQDSDLDFSDELGNVLVRFQDGGIKTKNFDSSKNATPEERGLMSAEDKVTLDESVEKLSTIEDGAEVNDVETDNTTNVDLDFSDELGNVLVRFQDGGIKTKNFDSASIKEMNLSADLVNRLNIIDQRMRFSEKKIAIIGDSISTYQGWLPSDIAGYDGSTYANYYPSGDINNVSKTWWYKLALMLELNPITNISNCAWSGSQVAGDSNSTTNAAAGCSNRRISDLTLRFNGESPDIIIVFIGCNDWGHDVSLGTWRITDSIPNEGTINEFRDAYALMLNKLHITYPLARIFCCTNLDDFSRDRTPGWPSNNHNGVSTYEWNQNIIEIAQAFGCEIIDFHSCGINYSNIGNYYAVDAGLHPNDNGHTLMANKAYNELISKY